MSVERARQLRKTMPGPEARLWKALRELGHHFRRQVPLGPYYADFCCHKGRLVVEVDGNTHFTDEAIAKETQRDAFIRGQGYRIIRATNQDVMLNFDGVLTTILAALNEPPPSFPPHKGEGSLRGG